MSDNALHGRGSAAWRLTVNVLAAVGAVCLALAGIVFAVIGDTSSDGNDGSLIQETVQSPTGAFRAVRLVSSGGGAAGWCRQFVLIRGADSTAELPTPPSRDELVFAARCSAQISLAWVASDELVVRYQLTPGELAELELRSFDRASKVSVRLETAQ